MFLWNAHGVTKIKVTVDNTINKPWAFPTTVHFYFLHVESLEEYELRYSLTRLSYDEDGVINNRDLPRESLIICDAKISASMDCDVLHCPPSVFVLQAKITDLIHELHRRDEPLYERYVVCDGQDPEGESDHIPF